MTPRRRFDITNHEGSQISIEATAVNWWTFYAAARAMGLRPTARPDASSPPVRLTFQHGSGSFASALTCNPRFREMLMGWPIGWTDPGERVTGWSAWLQRSRTALSVLTRIDEGDPREPVV